MRKILRPYPPPEEYILQLQWSARIRV